MPASPAAEDGDGTASRGAVEMPWSALSRFGGDIDGDGRLDAGPSQRSPQVLELDRVPIVVSASSAVCAAEERSWSLDGEPTEAARVGERRCRWLLGVPDADGSQTIAVNAGGRREVALVETDDRLIVAIGDSVASGQGNPEGLGRRGWLDAPCYRSSLAGFEQAARRFAEEFEREGSRRSITFVSLACSGAEVDAGLLGPQDVGRTTRKPQVSRLGALAAARGQPADGEATIDAVLLSIGGNDLGFASIVANCAAPGSCRKRRAAAVTERLAELPERLARLRGKLSETASGAPVLVSEYFDPTRGADGEFCRRALGAMSEDEARWAYEDVLTPLNKVLEEGAGEAGEWTYVGDIAADFRTRGYCVPRSESWVVKLSESLRRQFNHLGTMHPDRDGHEAIAGRVAAALAPTFDAATPAVFELGDDGDDDGWRDLAADALDLVPTALAPLALAVLLALAALAGLLLVRALCLLRPTWSDDPLEPRSRRPRHPAARSTPTVRRGLWLALLALAALAGAFLLSELAGRLIVLASFWAANLPPSQAADAVGAGELAVRGSGAIGLFATLGLAAIGLAWLLDGRGSAARQSRRGLVAIGLAELVLAVQLGDFRTDQALQLLGGLLVAGLLVYFLVERALETASALNRRTPLSRSRSKTAWRRLGERAGQLANGAASNPLRALYWSIPYVLLGYAVFRAASAEGPDRIALVILPYLAAVLAFALPGGSASAGLRRRGFEPGSLWAPRVALATGGVACILLLVVRDEGWLALSAGLAALLGLLCLAVAVAVPGRFAPYGAAIFVAAVAFGATTSVLRNVDSPELQPAAALLKDGDSLCGAYVGESDGRLWLARLRLDDRADVRRPRPGTIFSTDAERVARLAVGPAAPVARVETRAAQMRTALLAEEGRQDPRRGLPGCGRSTATASSPGPAASPRRAIGEAALMRRLADRYQPELVIDRHDGFWPIPVRAIFSMQDRRASACRRVAVERSGCLRVRAPGELPWSGGPGESIEYPAADEDPGEQHDLMVDALGSADPERTSLIYYLASRSGKGPRAAITIQYWFFYSFNYQPTSGFDAGYHEGDFESVTVLLSGRTHRPRNVWMARHGKAEGRLFAWNDPRLGKVDGSHPLIFVARGSHASYESCDRQRRTVAPYGLLDDHPACEDGRPLRVTHESAPLADLSRTAWACWEGLFGHASDGFYKETHLIGDAPRSPLWQQDLGDEPVEPCPGAGVPEGRHGAGEELVDESSKVPGRLREGAATMVPMVDDCEDWRQPALAGTYMVACEAGALRRYVRSGLERLPASDLRIEDVRQSGVATASVPAQRQDPDGEHLEDWQLVAARPATVTVYASCPTAGEKRGVAWVEFKQVRLDPGKPLRLLDRGPGGSWSLAAPRGEVVARARPFATVPRAGRLAIPPSPSADPLICGVP